MKKLILFILYVNFLIASESYDYYTKETYTLGIENNNLIFKHTIKDPNGISFFSQEIIKFEQIKIRGFKLISEDKSSFLFSTKEGYFLLDKTEGYIKENGIKKIFNFNEVTKTKGTHFFYLKDKWVYVVIDYLGIKIIELPQISSNFEIIDDFWLKIWLLKDDLNYYTLSNFEPLKIIPNLDIKSTKYYTDTREYNTKRFLYDDNTFYSLDSRFEYKDLSKNFNLIKGKKILSKMKFSNINNYTMDSNNLIWVYINNEYRLKSGIYTHFYPYKNAKFLNKFKDLIIIGNDVYEHSANYWNQSELLDISLVENIQTLRKPKHMSYKYTDDIKWYRFDSKRNKLIPTYNGLDINATYYPGVYSYVLGTDSFYKDKKELKYIPLNSNKVITKQTINTKIKKLGLAYAYDKTLLIENKEVKNIADFSSIEFIGSTSKFLEDKCIRLDIEDYKVPIVYYYFFKDKNNIYVYYSCVNEMKLLKKLSKNNFDDNDYETLKKLENISIRTVYKNNHKSMLKLEK